MTLSYYNYKLASGVKKIKTKTALAISGVTLGLGGLVIGLAALPLGAHAAVSSPACNVPTSTYPTIQSAVNSSSCTTINVAPGIYSENVTIPRPLTLKGAQVGVDARGRVASESIINGDNAANITITANNVTIDGFTLNGPVSQGTAAIVMNGRNTGETIKNNIVNNPGRAASFNTNDTIFTQNRVNNTLATAGDGFQANSTPLSNLTISDNTFSGAKPAIYNADITVIEGNSNVTVSGNNSNGDGTLIALFKTNGATISNNTVVGDGSSSAIYVGGGNSNVIVSGNTVSLAGTAVNVTNYLNTVGIYIGNNSGVAITENNLHNNKTGVKISANAVASENAVVAHNNSLTGNSDFGVNNLSPFTANATCNWWGASNGPGQVGTGSGDKVSTGVTYEPWLNSSNLNGACIGINVVTNKDQCKNDGWQLLTDANGKTFKNQGDCVSFVATNGKH